VISRYNVTLILPPGKFLEDKQGRRINDPYFDIYVKSGQLAREIAEIPVPLITVPVVTAPAVPVGDGQSVRAVTEFTMDDKGVRTPVIPLPKPVQEEPVNKRGFIGMTMDEAKRLGLVRKVREVPEDYGIKDTDSPHPPATPPPMRLAVDTDQLAKPSEQLPQPLVEAVPKKDAANRRRMQQALAKGAETTETLDSETGFLNVAQRNIPPNVGLAQPEATATSEPEGVEVLPAANLAEDALPAPPAEEEEEMPIPKPTVKPARVPPRPKPYVCIDCEGVSFAFRPELVGHAKKFHSEKVAAILAPYPG
jgi:hypothetical protein